MERHPDGDDRYYSAAEMEQIVREQEMARIPKMRHCFNCGAELGVSTDHEPLDTCGKQECERAAREILTEERERAHEQLDRDGGW